MFVNERVEIQVFFSRKKGFRSLSTPRQIETIGINKN